MEITYKEIRENKEINLLIEKGNQVMQALGYTEHSKKHAARVAETAGKILKGLGYSQKAIELSRIAGYMHDIGNSINRHDHAHSGAALAYQILKGMRMPLEDILVIVTAIGHHDESTGTAVDVVSAALILADKTDVRRNRVQNPNISSFDAHDRVNYAALSTSLEIKEEKKVIQVELELASENAHVQAGGGGAGLPVQAAGQREQALLKRGGSGRRQDLKKEFLFCFFADFRYTEYIKGRISPVPEKGERRMLCRTEKF